MLAKELANNNPSGAALLGPAAVNYSFALELRFKALLMLDVEQFTKGHDLLKIYSLLSKEVKGEIDKYFNELSQKKNGLPAYKLQVYKVSDGAPSSQQKSTGNKLEDLLTKHSRSFQNWRYLFEFSNEGYSHEFDFEGMDNLYNSMNSIIKKLSENRKGKFGLQHVKK